MKLPDLTNNIITADLFEILAGTPLAGNTKAMFRLNRRVVGGSINIVDIEFDDGVELRNVRISGERFVSIPADYRNVPIRNVGLPNMDRQVQGAPLAARFK